MKLPLACKTLIRTQLCIGQILGIDLWTANLSKSGNIQLGDPHSRVDGFSMCMICSGSSLQAVGDASH